MYPKNYYKAWHKSNTDFSSPVQMEINKLGTDSIMLFCSNVRHICYYHSRGIKPFFMMSVKRGVRLRYAFFLRLGRGELCTVSLYMLCCYVWAVNSVFVGANVNIGEMLTIDLSKYGRFVIPDGEVRSVYPKGVKRNKPSKKGLKLDSI